LGETGRAEVKRFVEAGGGYIGICAGAYLARSGFDWRLGLADAKTVSPLWQRGKGSVKVELTEAGQRLFGQRPEAFECLYAQGPIVQSAGRADLADYESLGLFRTEVAHNNTPKGIMVNSPAIFAGRFGQGRVLCFSPHPEQTKGLETMIPRAVLWVSAPAGSP
ncbi:MAG TPA: BPL-N domain-containing protein, partial [Bacillota bacterium]|nr:BPL-N domain-containing protein [Bacillota bacterium]